MIRQARKNHPDIRFEVADAIGFSFPEPFDAVFSNATLHWIQDQDAALRCIFAALKAGGRLAAELGGKGNVATILGMVRTVVSEFGRDLQEPRRYFPTQRGYTGLLEKHGFRVQEAIYFERPTLLDGGEQGMSNWLEMFAREMLYSAPPEKRSLVRQTVLDRLRPVLYKDGAWHADYVRLRILAFKPSAIL